MSQSLARNSDTASTKTVSSNRTSLIHGDQALADAIGAGLSTIRTWRAKRLIPYIKTGHKSVIYDLPKVLAALGTLEVKPVTSKGGK
ncbi:MAG: hypothetical protein WCK17_09200 [Verrucomicrobiota bacterium]